MAPLSCQFVEGLDFLDWTSWTLVGITEATTITMTAGSTQTG